MLLVDKSIKTQIKSQLPWFISQEYPLFVKFLEYYYEWLEVLDTNHRYGLQAIIDNYKNFRDIDKTLDELIPFFRKIYFRTIPENTAGSTRIFAKKIYQLYKAKGTIKSIEFLVYLILGTRSEVFLPKDHLAKSSNALYGSLFYLVATPINEEAFVSFFDTKYGSITIDNIEIPVLSVVRVGPDIHLSVSLDMRIEINDPTIFYQDKEIGTAIELLQSIKITNCNAGFQVGEIIRFSNDNSISPALVKVNAVEKGTVDKFTIISGGEKYKVGDTFISIENGLNFLATITRVGSFGDIIELVITNNNFNVDKIPTIISTSKYGNGANIKWQSTTIGKITETSILYVGVEVNSLTELRANKTGFDFSAEFSFLGEQRGFVSSTNLLGHFKTLQDNYYYQIFSYVIELQNNNNPDIHNVLKELIHPAGMKNFFREVIYDTLPLNSDITIGEIVSEEFIDTFLLILFYPTTFIRNIFDLFKYSNQTSVQTFFDLSLDDIDTLYNYSTTVILTTEDITLLDDFSTIDDLNTSLSTILDTISIN